MNKAIIFDLDGTILNTLEDLGDSLNYSLSMHNYPTRTLEEVRQFVGNGIYKLVARGVGEEQPKSITDAVYETFVSYYPTHCSMKTKPYEGIHNLLLQLSKEGYILGVLSNKANNAVSILCDKYFPSIFTFTQGAVEGIAKKPAPDALNMLEAKYMLAPSNIIYIGDSEVDIETARNARVKSIIVDWGFRTRDELVKNSLETSIKSLASCCSESDELMNNNSLIIVSNTDELYNAICYQSANQ